MHEAGIADRILDIAVEQCRAAGARRVTAVYLEAGLLAGVSEEALRFHWEQHAAGTPAEGAALHLAQIEEPTDLRFVSIEVEGDDVDEEDGSADAGSAAAGGQPEDGDAAAGSAGAARPAEGGARSMGDRA